MKKTFFKNLREIHAKNSYRYSERDLVKTVLQNKNVVAIYSLNGKSFSVFAQKDIVKLAKAFGISISESTYPSSLEAANASIAITEKISSQLVNEANDYFEKKELFKKGDFSFISPYQDVITLNKMLDSMKSVFKITTFEQMRDVCKSFSFTLDSELVKSGILKKIDSLDNQCSKAVVLTKKMELYQQLNYIQAANCYSRETFAMLCVRLEEWVQKEKAIEYFLSLLKGNIQSIFTKLRTTTISE